MNNDIKELIKKEIRIYKIILEHSDLWSAPYNFASGAIQALENILKEIYKR